MLRSSGVMWEEQKKRDRFKALNIGMSDAIEGAYHKFKVEQASNPKVPPIKKISVKLEVCSWK